MRYFHQRLLPAPPRLSLRSPDASTTAPRPTWRRPRRRARSASGRPALTRRARRSSTTPTRPLGPDGKRYPTWHPAVDPASGCRFGHEHGRDPRGSRLYGMVGAIPFGYANEQLDIWDPANPRHEDHVGHKVEWENDIAMRVDSDIASPLFDVRCDVLREDAPGHALEGRLHQQRARTDLPHRLQRRHGDAHHAC